ncbi:actin-like ATPase domain-containing protein [Hesseltinella vesiculosa]|uniref:Phosphotransferase n=1 Tax=Hesseltinella vesiculosa TaxID=101127 RepID=A0A1X2GMS2_9FUNG|nr:actin-like ATPase domain-containing protein [Hesseltinella vesiculosa]
MLTIEQNAILAQVEAQFTATTDHLEQIIKGFTEEMKAGLSLTGSTDMKMLPSFVTGHPTGYEQGTYLALEISGVDIYVCQVILKGKKGKLAINQYQYKIPDDYTTGTDVMVLINYVTDCIVDFLQRVGIPLDESLAMCISVGFAIKQDSLNQGIICGLEHGFGFTNAIGRDLVDLFPFKERGMGLKIVAVANGIVHGAGTNCSYYDRVANIKSLNSDDSDDATQMIINTEWCSAGAKHLPINQFDTHLDEVSNNQGIHLFEKMTTGMYLGELVRLILMHLCEKNVLSFSMTQPSKAATAGNGADADLDEPCLLDLPYRFDTSYMYVIEADQSDQLEDIRVILEEMCHVETTTLADRFVTKKVCSWVGNRAAALLGASVASVVTYMISENIVTSNEEFAIAISGDVYEDYPDFHPRVCTTVRSLIDEQVAARLSVGLVQYSRIIGASIVAMLSLPDFA